MTLRELGPYRISDKLGHGGMGTVYRGVHRETGQPAALKVLAAPLAAEEGFRERFAAEIETLRKLNHPNIVHLQGFGEQDGHLYYVMELVEGVSLEEELRQGTPFSWQEVVRIGLDVCKGLRHAHDRGIIHRDIKPGNLLREKDGTIKLSDFGIARLFGQNRITGAGSVLGTAEYMPPEQAGGGPIDARSDLYSLGGVLYSLLSHRPPFSGGSLAEILRLQQTATPEPLEKLAPQAPAALTTLIDQLLEKDPELRVPTAQVLARRLEAVFDIANNAASSVEGNPPSGSTEKPLAHGPAIPDAASLPDTNPMTQSDWPPPDRPAPIQDSTSEEWPLVAASGGAAASPSGEMATIAHAAPPPSEPPAAQGRFTPVAVHELDLTPDADGRRAWISPQTWILAACLIALGMAAWRYLQPPTADDLYQQIAAQAGDVESLKTVEPKIEEFLKRWPRDSRSKTLWEYTEELQLARLEARLERRAVGFVRDDSRLPVERDYIEAIQTARSDLERGAARLQAIIDLYEHRGETSGPVAQCVELARRRLARLQKQIDQHAEHRLTDIHDRLDLAEQLAEQPAKNEPKRARDICQAVLVLYSEKPWAKREVERARSLLARMGPEKQ